MVSALAIGITEELFWSMNPRRMNLYVKAYDEEMQHELELSNVVAYLQGVYFIDALTSTVGNMFSDKKSKPYEYPKEPYAIGKNNANGDEEELSEEEKQKQRDIFLAKLLTMQTNFNLSKGKGIKGQEQK